MSGFHYTGTDALEVMSEAKKYNTFLEKLVLKYAPKNGLLLDIGAGIGTFAQKLSSKGYNIHCIEPDKKQCKEIEIKGLKVDFSIEDIEDNSIDFIYSFNVLEHIENDGEALKSWVSKLKANGSILVYVPAFHVLYSSFDRSVGHYRRYRKKLLVNHFRNAGLQIEKIKYADSLGFFVSLLYKLINRGDGKLNKYSLIAYDRFFFPISRVCDYFCSNILGKNVYVIGKNLVCVR